MIGAFVIMDFQPEHNRLPLGYGEAYGLSTYTLPRLSEKTLTSLAIEEAKPPVEELDATTEKADPLQQKSDAKYLHFRVSRRVVGWARRCCAPCLPTPGNHPPRTRIL